MRPKTHIPTVRICTARNSVKNRWYVDVRIPQLDGTRKRYRYFGDINQFKTVKARKAEANILKEVIEDFLERGYLPSEDGWTKTESAPENKIIQITLIQNLRQTLELQGDSIRRLTTNNYRLAIDRFVEYLRLSDKLDTLPSEVNVSLAIGFQEYLNGVNLKNTTRNSYVRNLSNMFSRLVDKEILAFNPFKKVKRLKERPRSNRAFTRDEVSRFMEYTERQHRGLHLFSKFMYYCMVRRTELCNVRVKDIDLELGLIFIPARVEKTGHTAFAVIPEPFLSELKANAWSESKEWYIFGSDWLPAELPIHPSTVTHQMAKVLKHLEIADGATLYSWRHTAAKELAKVAHIKDVQLHMRHSSVATTDKYLRSLGMLPSSKVRNNYPKLGGLTK